MNRRDGAPVLLAAEANLLERIALDNANGGTFSEAWLQQLIAEHPECLPLADIEPGLDSLVSICREVPTEHGPIDNLFMTGRGDIVMVEVKLWRNHEARRLAVAQALDYATALFGMSYAAFEQIVLKGSFGLRPKPASLHACFPRHEVLDEAAFADAVSLNLTRGRIVVLIVGDGIRAEAERLIDGLQSHAGFHFTFALVELALFRRTGTAEILVQPRTLARTVMIERGIVRIDHGRVTVAAPEKTQLRETITSELFFEAMAALDPALPSRIRSLLARLEPLGVNPDYLRSLNLRWEPPTGRPINLGYINRDGQIWTDVANFNVSHALSHAYVTDLAAAWGGEVDTISFGENWHVRIRGKAPRAKAVDLDAWVGPIARFLQQVRAATAESAA